VRFGKLLKVHEMGCSQGTIMEVCDLFGKVPARKKFLKTIRTELSHIEEMVENYALSRPDLGLVLSVNGKNTISLPSGADTLKSRAKRLIYRRAAGSLIQIGNKSGIKNMHGEVTISGYLPPPDETQPGSSKLRLFVNGRSVRDRMITHAVAEGLRGFLMKGRAPSGIIFIRTPPDSVDVNVHPAKQEIRFHKSNIIHQMVVLAVSKGIKDHQDDVRRSIFHVPSNAGHVSSEDISPGQASEPETKFFAKNPPASPSSKESWPKPAPFSEMSTREPGHSVSGSEPQRLNAPCDSARDTFPPFSAPTQKGPISKPMQKSDPLQAVQQATALLTPPDSHEPATRLLRSLGQVLDSYILC
ncbi:MAG: hypothetical protein KAJ45_08850, partial [Desulfobulbaceae bacterium]|nr:hypothetical protein [Desulfobulbaceae bacterium]